MARIITIQGKVTQLESGCGARCTVFFLSKEKNTSVERKGWIMPHRAGDWFGGLV